MPSRRPVTNGQATGVLALVAMALIILCAGYLATGQPAPHWLQVLTGNVLSALIVVGTRT